MVEKMPLPASQHAFQVFVAKYNYDPVQYSPNENPEAELALTAGDYLFIYGEMDEVRWWCTHSAIIHSMLKKLPLKLWVTIS